MIKGPKELDKIVDILLQDSFTSSGQLNEVHVRKHVKILKLLPLPQSIIGLSRYLQRLKSELQKSTVEIESATPLSQTEIGKIIRALKADHPVLAVRTTVNPRLFGGLKIRIGDNVYDDSVSAHILQLGEEIKK